MGWNTEEQYVKREKSIKQWYKEHEEIEDIAPYVNWDEFDEDYEDYSTEELPKHVIIDGTLYSKRE